MRSPVGCEMAANEANNYQGALLLNPSLDNVLELMRKGLPDEGK